MANAPETQDNLILRLRDPEDSRAWSEFVKIYRPVLYRFASERGFQHADAEDLAQEVLASVSRGVRSWSPDRKRGRFRAWLFKIARNKTINLLTRRRYQSIGSGDTRTLRWIEDQPAPAQEDWTALDRAYRREMLAWVIKQARLGVAEETWQAFWLTYVQEEPVPTVAARLGLSVGAVYIARSRMLARLIREAKRCELELPGGGEPWQ
jgi:RNA polymerase sigma factor (sigma-70 family)